MKKRWDLSQVYIYTYILSYPTDGVQYLRIHPEDSLRIIETQPDAQDSFEESFITRAREKAYQKPLITIRRINRPRKIRYPFSQCKKKKTRSKIASSSPFLQTTVCVKWS